MATADNTLGAPTEGLGQTVTFAASGSRGLSQAAGSSRQAVRNNPASGGAVLTARALHVPEVTQDATTAALFKLGESLLKPKLEEAQTAAYVKGMQQAAQGQAITEIVDEQPWYSKLFGSTSLVDGARAYTASAKAASSAAGMEAKMPELRKLGADEFARYATEEITRQKTGDAATDMMLSKQIASTLPAVMKGQAKAHLVYQQEQFASSIEAAQTAAFANLGVVASASRLPGATRDDADVLGATIHAADVLVKPPEMSAEVYDKVLAKSAISAISSGNFEAYNLLKNSGKLAGMDATQAYHIERAYNAASSQAKTTLPPEMLVSLADFRTLARQPGVTDEDILSAAKNINEEYYRITGDPGKFLGDATTVAELQQMREYNDARKAALASKTAAATTKADKELAAIAETTSLAGRVVSGDGSHPYLMVSETPKEAQAVFDHLRVSASPEVRARVMVEQAAVAMDKNEQGMIEAAISTAQMGNDPTMLYNVYKDRYLPLVKAAGDDRSIASRYAGRYAELMANYHSLAQGQPVDASHQGIFYTEVVTPRPSPLTISKSNTALVNEVSTGWFKSLMPFTDMPIRDPEGYAAILKPKLKPYLDMHEAVKEAQLSTPTLALAGGYHWQRSEKATDLKTYVATNHVVGGMDKNDLDSTFATLVSEYSKIAGIDGTVTVGQTRDSASGEPQMYLMGVGSDGKAKVYPFKASDLQTVWKQRTNPDLSQPASNMDSRNLGESALDAALKAKPK